MKRVDPDKQKSTVVIYSKNETRLGDNPIQIPSTLLASPTTTSGQSNSSSIQGMAAAAARLPSAAARRTRVAAPHLPILTMLRTPPIQSCSRSRLVVASAQSNFSRVVQTAWRVGKDAVEAGTTLVPGSVPRPIARIGVTVIAVSVALFLFKSVVSTAFFVLAMMGLIYFGFLAMNPEEGSRVDDSSEDPVEEARRIMEKYK